MFKDNTTFIVGAGASAEMKMPVGNALADTISKACRFDFDFGLKKGDQVFFSILQRKYRDHDQLNQRLKAARKISDSIYMSSSIDNFIDTHDDDDLIREIGKAQIAYHLLKHEEESSIFYSRDNGRIHLDLRAVNNTWLDPFARILFEKIKKSQVEEIGSNISIICFNYDRCIEFFLIEAISQTFSIDYATSHNIVYNMNIIHPYGTLGVLPDQPHFSDTNATPFGQNPYEIDIWPVAENIKTYTEQIEDKATIERIKQIIESTKNLVFLGFAFHPQNMKLLETRESMAMDFVCATGRGISEFEIDSVLSRIARMCSINGFPSLRKEHIHCGAECKDLFRFHWRNLSSE